MKQTLASTLLGLLAGLTLAEAALAQSVTPVRAIRSQSILSPDDLAVNDATVPGAFASLEEVVGREARVTLYPGRPIMANQIGAPALVDRNQVVRMNFAAGSLAITAEGRALDRGGVGDVVRVMNLSSRQIVSGAVAPDGSIEVGQ